MLHSVRSQNGGDLICTAAEAWNGASCDLHLC